jgi:hypothetical protein
MNDTQPECDFQAVLSPSEAGYGPLCVVEIAGESVIVATFRFPDRILTDLLSAGNSVEALIAKKWSLWQTVARFELSQWRELSWIEGSEHLAIVYEQGDRTCRVLVDLAPDDQRDLAEWLETRLPGRIARETRPVNPFELIRPYLQLVASIGIGPVVLREILNAFGIGWLPVGGIGLPIGSVVWWFAMAYFGFQACLALWKYRRKHFLWIR